MKKTYKQLVILLWVFALPIAASWFLYHYHTHFRLHTLNHGTLIKPPIEASYLDAKTPNDAQKRWRVIYVSGETCDDACQQIDHQLKQVQKALGKDSDRVVSLTLNAKSSRIAKLKQSFARQGSVEFVTTNKIYLVDPHGNLFMYYPSDVNPMDILKDLKRVLEVSQIG